MNRRKQRTQRKRMLPAAFRVFRVFRGSVRHVHDSESRATIRDQAEAEGREPSGPGVQTNRTASSLDSPSRFRPNHSRLGESCDNRSGRARALRCTTNEPQRLAPRRWCWRGVPISHLRSHPLRTGFVQNFPPGIENHVTPMLEMTYCSYTPPWRSPFCGRWRP